MIFVSAYKLENLERSKTVEGGGKFLEAKFGEVARGVGIEGGEAVCRDEGGDVCESFRERSVAIESVFPCVGQGPADGAGLGVVDQLRKEGEVDFLAAKAERARAVGFDILTRRTRTMAVTTPVATIGARGFEGID